MCSQGEASVPGRSPLCGGKLSLVWEAALLPARCMRGRSDEGWGEWAPGAAVEGLSEEPCREGAAGRAEGPLGRAGAAVEGRCVTPAAGHNTPQRLAGLVPACWRPGRGRRELPLLDEGVV